MTIKSKLDRFKTLIEEIKELNTALFVIEGAFFKYNITNTNTNNTIKEDLQKKLTERKVQLANIITAQPLIVEHIKKYIEELEINNKESDNTNDK